MSIAVMTYFIIMLFGWETHVETEMGTKRQNEIEKERDINTYVCIVIIAVVRGENRVAGGNADPGLKHS